MAYPLNILPNEGELFAHISRGDEAAFTEVFLHYSARIFPFVQKMTRSEQATQEIVQDVFVNIWKNRHKLEEIQSYASWIFTIATNLTYNYLKGKSRELKRRRCMRFDESINTTIEFYDLKECKDALRRVVEQLPPQRQLIYKLSREEGLSHEEIAQQLKISKNTVKNQLVSALKYIKEHLDDSTGAAAVLIAVLIRMHK